MTATGLEIFDKTVQTTNTWLQEIGETIGPDRQRCYHALRAVLFTLRDRLTADEAAHLAAQLPMLVRGIFYDGYRPSGQPGRLRSRDEFLAKINEHIGQIAPLGSDDAARAVFKVLAKHVARGEIDEVKQSLPGDIRTLFPDSDVTDQRPARSASETSGALGSDEAGETKRHGDKLEGAVRQAAQRRSSTH